jgi:tRNA threonylcarbamoyladenosine modification (KEOPS) complex  Pcc1 subunit
MSQDFVKGRTTNHLTWVMVDATDFGTPESALSAATKIKIYGKLRANDTVQFVSSGTGSLTNDIKHVGASVLGIYTIGLVKADLSDASAAWYDQYIISLSATGAAYQTLVVDGGIDASALSALQSRMSDVQSYLVAMSGMLSDTHSAAILGASHASDAHSAAILAASAASDAHSATLIVQSRLSDLDSLLASHFSDLNSALVAMSGIQSDIYSLLSDLDSNFGSRVPKRVATDSQLSDVHSDLASKIAGITASVSASDISDIASAVYVILSSDVSDLLSRTTQINSRVLLNQSRISDVQSYLVALSDQLSDAHSDLASKIGGITVTISASDVSDIASAVVAALPITSVVSDIYSLLSDLNSNFHSRIPKEPAARSQLSDLSSDLLSYLTGLSGIVSDAHSAAAAGASRALLNQSRVSDIYSLLSDFESNFGSRVPKRVATDSQLSDLHSDLLSYLVGLSGIASDAHSAAAAGASRALLNQSRTSDIYSLLSDLHSDVAVMSGVVSDVYSNLAAGVTVSASDMSDLRSAITANGVLRAGADPTAVVGVTDTLAAKVDWLTAVSRNKVTQTATVQSLRNDNDSADIASAAVSDDGTTFTRGEFA